jgi:WD40 repeat protein
MHVDLISAAFHPDGHLFAAGGTDGQVKMYHVKTGEFAAGFDCGGPVKAISFSENGIWFSTAIKGSSSVTEWSHCTTIYKGLEAVVRAETECCASYGGGLGHEWTELGVGKQ